MLPGDTFRTHSDRHLRPAWTTRAGSSAPGPTASRMLVDLAGHIAAATGSWWCSAAPAGARSVIALDWDFGQHRPERDRPTTPAGDAAQAPPGAGSNLSAGAPPAAGRPLAGLYRPPEWAWREVGPPPAAADGRVRFGTRRPCAIRINAPHGAVPGRRSCMRVPGLELGDRQSAILRLALLRPASAWRGGSRPTGIARERLCIGFHSPPWDLAASARHRHVGLDRFRTTRAHHAVRDAAPGARLLLATLAGSAPVLRARGPHDPVAERWRAGRVAGRRAEVRPMSTRSWRWSPDPSWRWPPSGRPARTAAGFAADGRGWVRAPRRKPIAACSRPGAAAARVGRWSLRQALSRALQSAVAGDAQSSLAALNTRAAAVAARPGRRPWASC